MSAVLKEIAEVTTIKKLPLCRPFFDTSARALYTEADFVSVNHASLVDWFEQLRAANECELDCTFEEFCGVQYDLAIVMRDKRELEYDRMRAERDHERREARYSNTYDRDTGIRRHGEI
jgi:hypothetical protein